MSGGGLILLLVLGLIYFLPSIIGGARGKRHGMAGVIILNLLLGWTVVGWFGALIWASSGETEADYQRAEQRHRELIARLPPR